ncbi:hypothetical protein LCGC14_2559880 [marine sediment metagenome]|uniref:Uncharacterized protein n=1 Tax=marine sediment metagenome TaxID=412755 RepID=A0A0F9DDF5_9ZZZZ
MKVLKAKKLGGDKGYVAGHSLCAMCRSPLQVTGTIRDGMDDGRVMEARKVKCTGKHRHTYTIKRIVG